MGFVLDTVGKIIAGYLQKEVPGYEPFTPSDPERLRVDRRQRFPADYRGRDVGFRPLRESLEEP